MAIGEVVVHEKISSIAGGDRDLAREMQEVVMIAMEFFVNGAGGFHFLTRQAGMLVAAKIIQIKIERRRLVV